MPLYRIVYFSRAGAAFDLADTHDHILAASRRNNESRAVSGALVAGNGYYLQSLEGRRAAVSETFLRIAADRRHDGVELLEAGPVDERLFAPWSMLFIDLHETPPVEIRRFTADHTFNPCLMTPTMALAFLAATARYATDHAPVSDLSNVILL